MQAQIDRHRQLLQTELARVEQEVAAFLASCPALLATVQLLRTILGVGLLTAATLVACRPELGQLGRTAIASLVGVAPPERGEWATPSAADHQGRPSDGPPRVLYLAALAGVRHNPWLWAFHELLRAAGKPPTVG
ncbi:hypothetical protein HRbin27_01503 [bacterium HR27]|nr:hypothetical protein HRbin27_01503 [bacterium HR27]